MQSKRVFKVSVSGSHLFITMQENEADAKEYALKWAKNTLDNTFSCSFQQEIMARDILANPQLIQVNPLYNHQTSV